MNVRVKICGITSAADAAMAVDAGANMIGLVCFDQSPRHVSLEQAAEIARVVPPYVLKVGVFVNPTAELVHGAIAAGGLNLLQFHGEESPEFCAQFGVMSIKAFRIRDAESLKALPAYPTEAWLLDTYSPKGHGGTGETFNWDLAVAASQFGRPIILAGGLTPGNVAEAVRRVQPFAVDVSSGVEAAPGKKDAAKVKAFIEAATTAVRPA